MAESARGILLFAHGSRDARWREPVEAVMRRVQAQDTTVHVACAYLELVAPDLPTAACTLVESGARRIRVVPLFLGMGKHVREDLPQLLDDLRNTHPSIDFSLASAVGEEPAVIELLANIALKE
ncbi:MAG: CbiX/SirB N-terminal domain-containing protein [Pseudomonadota bacterium]